MQISVDPDEVIMAARENWTMTAIGGATGLCVTVFYVFAREHGVTPGDWLQFAGIFLGIAATIGGTLWLQRHAERVRLRNQAENLVQAVKSPQEILSLLKKEPRNDPIAHVGALDSVVLHMVWARGQLEGLTYKTHSTVETFVQIWELRKAAFQEAAHAVEASSQSSTTELITLIDYFLLILNNVERIVREEHLIKAATKG